MSRTPLLLMLLVALLGLIAWLVAQVAQPARGYIIAFMLVVFPLLLGALRIMRHLYAYKEALLMVRGAREPQHLPNTPSTRPTGFRVIEQSSPKNGRKMI